MGAVLAKFRKEKSTAEKLERLEAKIQQIEKYTLNTQTQKKRFVGNFLAASVGIYVIAFLIFYFIYFPPTWKDRIFYLVPMLLFPVVIILLRKLFTWYFQRKLNKNSSKLKVLRDEKKLILEQVMDKETYKVALNLLTRFGDKSGTVGRLSVTSTPRIPSASTTPLNQTVRDNQLPLLRATSSLTTMGVSPRGVPAISYSENALALPRQWPLTQNTTLRRRTPFPIVNQQEKSVFERIVDMLIGDGPQDRFAMICKECFAHNGMALKEEFDYLTFRCAFCNILNPSRKERPVAPRLPIAQLYTGRRISNSTDSNESTASSDNETELVEPKQTTDSDFENVTEKETETTDINEAAMASAAAETVENAKSSTASETVVKKIQIDEALSILRDEFKKKEL